MGKQQIQQLGLAALIGLCLGMTGCASTTASSANNDDPYETFNRHAYNFNDGIDKAVIKPVATVYHRILPYQVTEGVTNFFSNLNEIPTVINDVLQANFSQAGHDTVRFVLNTTLGIGGLFDVGTRAGLQKNNEDFGLTLAKWGYTNSHYLVLPFFGPSTVRDTVGLPFNYAMTPYSYYSYISSTTSTVLYATNLVNTRSNYLNYDKVLAQQFDPYIFVRSAYLQIRNNQIAANETGHPSNAVTTTQSITVLGAGNFYPAAATPRAKTQLPAQAQSSTQPQQQPTMPTAATIATTTSK